MIALLAGSVLVSLALVLYVIVLRRRIVELREQRGSASAEGDDLTPGASVIVIDVKNVAEVATQRTVMARPLATLAPGVLRSIVVRQTIRQMREHMAAEGLEADVHVRRLPARTNEPVEVIDQDLG